MSTSKKTESARFVISNPGGCVVSFASKGNMIAILDDAFGWLTTERREKALKRMQETHARLLALENKPTA
jgi:outer membrane lipoprotein-sorting protein